MDLDWSGIDHITKIDPAKRLPDDLAILEDTDLIMVGGSDGVTAENTLDAIRHIRTQFPTLTVFQEPYRSDQVTRETIDAADYLSVPAVYNGDYRHFLGKQIELFTELGNKPDELFGSGLPIIGDLITSKGREIVSGILDKIIAEGYVIQHCDSKAAAVSGVEERYTTEQIAGAALATETFYRFPIFYVEYSGTYGGPEDVAVAAAQLNETTLLYGGGIESASQTREILNAGADAVVVGDCFHDDPDRYLGTIP